ncbi:MAG: hypothetical protein OXL97_12040 [Chloroflexota bacterium]|nr:hypothetical protein [Chloroflexota bacterium]MDE2885750.1 hypothetical protein [Chloroflexota bacterium]
MFKSGESIPDFPSDRAYAGNFKNGVQLAIAGGNVVIQMSNGGTVEYSHATYTCVDTGGCRIENGTITAGAIRVSDAVSPSSSASSTPTATPTPVPTAIPTATPTQTATPTSTPTPTPVGPAVEVANLECSGEGTLGSISYEVTGEIHANRNLEDVQVGYGVDSFTEIGFGNWMYFGLPGTSVNLGSMSADESRFFELSFNYPFELTECGIEVVWKEPR